MDTVTFGKDEASHSRVPALSLMTEVNAGLKELLHRNWWWHGQGNSLKIERHKFADNRRQTLATH